MERYARQIDLPGFGEEKQRRLAEASVLIVGLGGLGAPVATYLSSSGLGRIGLCDIDTVSITNLQRQILYCDTDVGHSKVGCAHNRLSSMYPATVFESIDCGLTQDNAEKLIGEYDIVMDCTDNFATRLLIDETCQRHGKPWIHGSLDGMYGSVCVFNHKNRKRYTDLFPDTDSLTSGKPHKPINVLGPVPGVIGSLQAIEAIKVLTDYGQPLDGEVLILDLSEMQFQKIKF